MKHIIVVTWLVAVAALGLVASAVAVEQSKASHNDVHINNFNFQSLEMNYELSTNVVPPEFCDPNSPLSISGYFGVTGSKYDDSNSKNYFYWFFERRTTSLSGGEQQQQQQEEEHTDATSIPLLIWLNGGPGCSSLLGLLEENGPCLVNKDGHSTRINPHSWTEAAHVLYLDQPSMSGYSYKDSNNILEDDNTDDMIAEDAYFFLQSFFSSPEGSKYKDLPLYLTGESYAGHYIPAIAHRIRIGNKNLKTGHLHLPLAGIAIGNGFYDLEEQVKSFPEMAYNNCHGMKIITEDEYKYMKDAAKMCSRDAHKCKSESNELKRQFLCHKASNCEEDFFEPLTNNGRNISIYDITKPCIGPDCMDDTPATTFLNLNKTKKTLGVPPKIKWEACNDHISRIWSDVDESTNFAPYISEMLNDNIPVLIYSGDLDYICNYLGNHAVAMKLEWNHGNDFRAADDHDWNNGGGLARSSHGLHFLQVYQAGHMVPRDQPEQALQMIKQFLNRKAF